MSYLILKMGRKFGNQLPSDAVSNLRRSESLIMRYKDLKTIDYYKDNWGWTVRGSNSGGGEIFRTRPDRP